MAQVDYNAIKKRNKEHSERPKSFDQLKYDDYLWVLNIDTLERTVVKIHAIHLTYKEEKEMSWLDKSEGEWKTYPYTTVDIELCDYNDKSMDKNIYKIYGTQTFVKSGVELYFTSERECSMVESILREKCECQVSHLSMMFNSALATKQYRDPRMIRVR